MAGLTRSEIMKLVNRYIGVSGGFLGDFSYRTHADFYSEYCDLDINPYEYTGTTRERFIQIISSADPLVEARIVRGVLEHFPVGEGPRTRTQELRAEFIEAVQRLESSSPVATPTLRITREVVARAIADAEALIKANGATSGVDRIHTALHGFLFAVCDEAGLSHPPDASLTQLFKVIRESHPALHDIGPRDQDITQVLRACSAIMDALNPVRNRATVAHPNDQLLGQAEAMLVINVARTLLHYLDARLS
ncbi:MAG TPA: abortive infection family protein [Armatimonadota bacterium]|nr:abortive infection family protein [Armatimonadota bacterium]